MQIPKYFKYKPLHDKDKPKTIHDHIYTVCVCILGLLALSCLPNLQWLGRTPLEVHERNTDPSGHRVMASEYALPSGSPLKVGSKDCQTAECLLAATEQALWQCAIKTATIQGCHEKGTLTIDGGLDPSIPYYDREIVPDAPYVTVQNAILMEERAVEPTVEYSILANDGKSTYKLHYMTFLDIGDGNDKQARLFCISGACKRK